MKQQKNKSLLPTVAGLFLVGTMVLIGTNSQAQTTEDNYVKTYQALKAITGSISSTYNKDEVSKSVEYYDGLGRPIQVIGQEQSVNGNDLVTIITYDAYGRRAQSYLPYEASTTAGNYIPNPLPDQSAFYQNVNSTVAVDVGPYARTIFESSELNRPFKQGAPGAAWQPNADPAVTTDKVIRYSYEANSVTDNVLVWDINFSTDVLSSPMSYPANELTKTTTTDEHSHAMIEFTDKQGRTVLKRVQAHKNGQTEEWADTYYVYDDYGNLRYVLPPEGSSEANTEFQITGLQTISQGVLDRWAFQYQYDGRNRMTQKRVPGAEWVYMVYDNRDRLVLTQDGNQRSNNEWLFTKYDQFNRPVTTGIYPHSSNVDQVAMQAVVDAHYQGGPDKNFYELHDGGASDHGYTNRSFPTTGLDYLTVTYYDNYDYKTQTEFGTDFDYDQPDFRVGGLTTTQGTYDYEATAFTSVKGQVTGSKVKVLNTTSWILSATYYDDRFRVIQTMTKNNYHGTSERMSSLYNFPGWMLESYRSLDYAGNKPAVRQRYEYDHAGRVLNGYHEVYNNSGVGQGEVLLAQNSYNEIGELIEKNLHVVNGNPQQSVDYRYNIRGWLESINNSLLDDDYSNVNLPTDYFGMDILYNNPLNGVTPGN